MQGRCTEDGWTTSQTYLDNDVIISDYQSAGDGRLWENQTNGATLYMHHSKWINPYGKYYWELSPSGATSQTIAGFYTSGNNTRPGYTSKWSWSVFMFSNNWNHVYNSSVTSMSRAYTSGEVLQFAVDQITGKAWIGFNGTWYNSGDPANGTNPIWTNINRGNLVTAASQWSIGAKYISFFKESQMNYSIPTGFQAPVI